MIYVSSLANAWTWLAGAEGMHNELLMFSFHQQRECLDVHLGSQDRIGPPAGSCLPGFNSSTGEQVYFGHIPSYRGSF